MVLDHAPLDIANSLTLLHALGAVYPEAREARGGANHIVIRRRCCTIDVPPKQP